MIVNILDAIAAIIIVVSVLLKFKNKWIWLLYFFGCAAYVFISFYKGLCGAAIMNIIISIIAIKHFFSKN